MRLLAPPPHLRLLAWFARIGAAALVSAFASTGIVAQETSDGIRVMAREKSLAEQFLVIMNDFGRKDINQYAKGLRSTPRRRPSLTG